MAALDSIRLVLLIGPGLPVPAPPQLVEMLHSVEVTQDEDGPSGFQLSFLLGRAGLADTVDHALLLGPVLKPFNRVIVMVVVKGIPTVLMDGIVTHRQHAPDTGPGDTLLTITGEDVSVMMDLEERRDQHPCCNDLMIAGLIVARYAQYQIVPLLSPPLALDPPLPIERVPSQQGTDRQFMHAIARRNGFVFYVEPGEVPFVNYGYWGPPRRPGLPQPALSTGMGPGSNVEELSFGYDALSAATVADQGQDSRTGMRFPVQTFTGLQVPPLALAPALPAVLTPSRKQLADTSSGVDAVQALARAQAATDRSTDAVVTAKGRLDVLRYGSVLKAHRLVGVRGAGLTHDGIYHVRRVTHRIAKGSYAQDFTLVREGEVSTTPVVVP